MLVFLEWFFREVSRKEIAKQLLVKGVADTQIQIKKGTKCSNMSVVKHLLS